MRTGRRGLAALPDGEEVPMSYRARTGSAVIAALAGSVFTVSTASAQVPIFDTLKFDVNQIEWFAASEDVVATTYTGSLEFEFNADLSQLQPVEGRDGGLLGPFSTIGDGGTLAAFSMSILFDAGSVVSGSVSWLNDLGDSVSGTFAEAGGIVVAPGGYLRIDGLVTTYSITDAGNDRLWGPDVDLSDFYLGLDSSESVSNDAFGDFAVFRLTEAASGGTSDAEFVLTTVPTPGTAAIAALGVAGVTRRRR